MKRVFTFLLAGALLFGNLSCTKDELCKTLAKCDLASRIVIPAASIIVGTDLSVLGTLLNIAASNVGCTESAPPSESDFYPFYRADASSPWQQLSDPTNNIIPFPTLAAGSDKTQERKYLFNAPGQYQFRKNADYNDNVEERDETNNGFELTGGRVIAPAKNNEYVSEIITVHPDPNRPYDPSKPKIELLEVKWVN